MSLSEEKKILLSQLVDGELPLDQANQVLAEVLGELTPRAGSAEAAGHLRAMLQLRADARLPGGGRSRPRRSWRCRRPMPARPRTSASGR